MTKQQIFKAAHKLAKTSMSTSIKYSVRLSIALKKVYATSKIENEVSEFFQISLDRNDKKKQIFAKAIGATWNYKNLTWDVTCKRSELKGNLGMDLSKNIAVAKAAKSERQYNDGDYAYDVLSGNDEGN